MTNTLTKQDAQVRIKEISDILNSLFAQGIQNIVFPITRQLQQERAFLTSQLRRLPDGEVDRLPF